MKRCPICNRKLRYDRWDSEFGLDEYIIECSCGKYKDHWYYGQREYVIGNWSTCFTDHAYMSEEGKKIADTETYKFFTRLRYYKKRKVYR